MVYNLPRPALESGDDKEREHGVQNVVVVELRPEQNGSMNKDTLSINRYYKTEKKISVQRRVSELNCVISSDCGLTYLSIYN